jgi:hypothetical protein
VGRILWRRIGLVPLRASFRTLPARRVSRRHITFDVEGWGHKPWFSYPTSGPLRLEYPGAVYHVTSWGNERAGSFLDDRDRESSLSILGSVVKRYNVLCYAYCLMDNHYDREQSGLKDWRGNKSTFQDLIRCFIRRY